LPAAKMMILIPDQVADQLVHGLKEAGNREIGGILMGEHIDIGCFRICEVSVQSKGGTLSHFIRRCSQAIRPLMQFFEQTGRDYRRFNYLGEWHSHPSFPVEPSARDHKTMWEIVHDRTVGANFAVLLIVRLDADGTLMTTASVYAPGYPVYEAEIVREGINDA